MTSRAENALLSPVTKKKGRHIIQITNTTGLPIALAQSIERSMLAYDKVGWRSVTTLNDSPRICMLRERHEKDIVLDVKDLTWLWLGTVLHANLEKHGDTNSIVEQRILVPFMGKEISMKADHIDPIPGTDPQEFTVQDYKITQVYAWKMGVKGEQEAQNNLYRWGYRKMGINCTKGELEMFLKDFSQHEKMIHPHKYPQSEVMRVPVADWTNEKCESYLKNKVSAFLQAEKCSDNDLPECTPNQRGYIPDRFAVKLIKDGKLADKASPGASSFESRAEAEQWIRDRKDKTKKYQIEFRKGENRRCERNACWVNKWCSQFNCNLQPDF